MIPGQAQQFFEAAAAQAGGGEAGYKIDRGLRFNSADSAYLNRTPAFAGNRRTWTWSGWVKRSKLNNQARLFNADINSSDRVELMLNNESENHLRLELLGSSNSDLVTSQVFRDVCSWYHIVVAVDTTQSTSSERVKIYVNGTQITSFSTETYPSQNNEYAVNATSIHSIGRSFRFSRHFDGYLAEIHFIDGQALAPTDFGEYDEFNNWNPKAYTFTTNPNNGTTWSNNTTGTAAGARPFTAAFDGSLSTWFQSDSGLATINFSGLPAITSLEIYAGITTTSDNQFLYVNGVDKSSLFGASAAWVTVPGITTLTSIASNSRSGIGVGFIHAIKVNGYVLLDGADDNSFHLPFSDNSSNAALGYDAAVDAPTVNPDGGFDVVTYSGDGTNNRDITGLGFSPDLVWIKARNQNDNHILADTVRGPDKIIFSQLDIAERSDSTVANSVTAFNSDGFTVGDNADAAQTNQSGFNYVAWCWKAGGTASSNTDGSITSQVSASTDYGFSIVTYTGTGSAATVGHGLGVAPSMIIVKNRSSAVSWGVGHVSPGWSVAGNLNNTNSFGASSYFNSTAPTSTVFSVGASSNSNGSGNNMVAYCFAPVDGYSSFGSYTGNGSSTGPTVTTGFKPRFLLIKNTNNTDGWSMWDSARNPSNPVTLKIEPNSSGAEGSNSVHEINFLDDGFQILGTWNGHNGSGNTMIYAAFADRPGNNWDVNNLVAKAAGLETANQGFDVVTYTGNGSTQTISGLNFSPDLVWLKMRSTTGYSHKLVDQVRGATKSLVSNNSNAELTETSGLTAFTSDGFSLGSQDPYNRNNDTFVAWCWRAGGTPSSNTDGSITSSVSANTTYGFSIVKYSGKSGGGSWGHSLNTPPEFIIFKRYTAGQNWFVWLRESDGTYLEFEGLNNDRAAYSSRNNVSATNSVVTLTTAAEFNSDTSSNYIAYCWSEVAGFSKFDSYSGGTANQTISTGFKPRYLLIKREDAANSWLIFDSARGVNKVLKTESSGAETTASSGVDEIEFLNDGFKLISTNNGINGSGGTYIYAAFADRPPGEIIDSLIDTPTNYEADSGNNGGNYATLNPLYTGATLSDGNLKATKGSLASWEVAASNIGMKQGKWYAELTIGTGNHQIGIVKLEDAVLNASNTPLVDFSWGWGFINDGSTLRLRNYYIGGGGSTTNVAFGASGSNYVDGDVLGLAYDADTQAFSIYKNGTLVGDTTSTWVVPPPAGTYAFAISLNTGNVSWNFGQRPFAYTPPTGFKSLCTTNLPDPTIADGSKYFDTIIASGTGASKTFTMPGGFGPGLVWAKQRNGATNHALFDVVRGATKRLVSNANQAEDTQANQLSAFTSDGFTYGSDIPNASGNAGVYWAWDGGSSTVSNTDGSITSSVRANPSAGFSIVSYTGTGSAATIGHGLNAKPVLNIFKRTGASTDWLVYTDTIDGSWDYLVLNSTAAKANTSVFSANSSTFDFSGASNGANASGGSTIAYCFAPVEGYSAFGSYTGNGSSNGPFVFTGFKVAFLLTKRTDTSENWEIRDSTRNPYNRTNLTLFPHSSGAEDTGSVDFDFLSNGFKVRNTNGSTNANGGTYIYAAFAEHPFKTARAR